MSLEMPSELDWLFKLLAGQEWPKGDEDKLRALGRAWTEFSTSVQEISGEFEPLFSTVTSNLSGQPAEAFKQFVTQMHQQLPAMVDAGKQIAKLSSSTAQQVEYSKYMIIGQLVLLAAELAWAAANAFWTFGASEAMTPAFIAATRLTVSMILRRLAMAILTGVVSQVALDVAIQTIQAIKAKINGDDFSWNWGNTASAAEMGAIGGALGGGIGMGLNKFKTTGFGDTFGGQLLTGGLSGLGMTEISNLMNHDDSSLIDGLTSGLAGSLGGGGRRGHGGDTPHMGDIHVGDVNNVKFDPGSNKFGSGNDFVPPPEENFGNGNGNHSGLDGLENPPTGVGGNNFTSNGSRGGGDNFDTSGGNNGSHVPVESEAPPPQSGNQNTGGQNFNNGNQNENTGGQNNHSGNQNPPVQHEDNPSSQQNVPPPVETPPAQQPPRQDQGSQQSPPPSRSNTPPPQQSAPPRGQGQNPPGTHQAPPPATQHNAPPVQHEAPPVEHNAPPVQHQTETPPPAQVHTPPPVSEHGQTPPPVEQHPGGQQSSPPPVQHNAPPVEHNAPPVEHNAPPVRHEAPPVQHQASPPPVEHNAPPVQRNQPPVEHNAPPVQQAPPTQHEAPPVQHEAPPVQHEAPPVQHEAPPVQHNEPPVGQEAPPVEHNAPPVQHEAPPVEHNAPPVQHQDDTPQGQHEQSPDNTADHNLGGPVRTASTTTGGGADHSGPTRSPQSQPHTPEEAAPPPMVGGQNHDDAPANNNRNSGDYRQTTPPPSRSVTPGPDPKATARPNDTNTPKPSEPAPPKRVDTSTGGPAKPKTEADKTPVTEHDAPESPKTAQNEPPKQQATPEPPKEQAPPQHHDDSPLNRGEEGRPAPWWDRAASALSALAGPSTVTLDLGHHQVEAHDVGGMYKFKDQDVYISHEFLKEGADFRDQQEVLDQIDKFLGDGLTLHRGVASHHPRWNDLNGGEIPPLGRGDRPDFSTRDTRFVPFTASFDIAKGVAIAHTNMGPGDDRRFIHGYDPNDPNQPVGRVMSKTFSAANGDSIAFLVPGETQIGGPIRDFTSTDYRMNTPLHEVFGPGSGDEPLGSIMPKQPSPDEVANYVDKYNALRHDPSTPQVLPQGRPAPQFDHGGEGGPTPHTDGQPHTETPPPSTRSGPKGPDHMSQDEWNQHYNDGRDRAPHRTVNIDDPDVIRKVPRTHDDGRPAELSRVDGKIHYDLRRMEVEPGRWVREHTVKFHLDPGAGVSKSHVEDVKQRISSGVDKAFNNQHKLPNSGDELHVRVEFHDDPAAAHETIRVDKSGPVNQHRFPLDGTDREFAHEVGHYAGLPDRGNDAATREEPHRQAGQDDNVRVFNSDDGRRAKGLDGGNHDLRNRIDDGSSPMGDGLKDPNSRYQPVDIKGIEDVADHHAAVPNTSHDMFRGKQPVPEGLHAKENPPPQSRPDDAEPVPHSPAPGSGVGRSFASHVNDHLGTQHQSKDVWKQVADEVRGNPDRYLPGMDPKSRNDFANQIESGSRWSPHHTDVANQAVPHAFHTDNFDGHPVGRQDQGHDHGPATREDRPGFFDKIKNAFTPPEPVHLGDDLSLNSHREGGFHKLDDHNVFISSHLIDGKDPADAAIVYDQVKQYLGDGLTLHRGISAWHPTWSSVEGGHIPPLGSRPHPDFSTRDTKYVPFSADRDVALGAAMGHTGMGSGDDRRFVHGYDPNDPAHPVGMVVTKTVSAAHGDEIAFINSGETQLGGPIEDFGAKAYHMGDPVSAVFGGPDDGRTLGSAMPPKPDANEIREYTNDHGGLRRDPSAQPFTSRPAPVFDRGGDNAGNHQAGPAGARPPRGVEHDNPMPRIPGSFEPEPSDLHHVDEPEHPPLQSHGPNLDNIGLVESVLRSSAFQHVPVEHAGPFVGHGDVKSTVDSVISKVAQDPHRFNFEGLNSQGLSHWAAEHIDRSTLEKSAPDLEPHQQGLSDDAKTRAWRDALANDLAMPSARRWQVVRATLGDHATPGDHEVVDHVTKSVTEKGILPTPAELVTKGLQTPSWNDSHVGKHLPDTVAHALDLHVVVDHNGEQTHHGPADGSHVEIQSHDGHYSALGQPNRQQLHDGMRAWLSGRSTEQIGHNVVDLMRGRQDEGLFHLAQDMQRLKRVANHPDGPQGFMNDLLNRADNLTGRIEKAESQASWKPKALQSPGERAAEAERKAQVKQLDDLLKDTNRQITHLKANQDKVGVLHALDKFVAGPNADGLKKLGPNVLRQLDEHLTKQISAAEKAGFDPSDLRKLHERVQNEPAARQAWRTVLAKGVDGLKDPLDKAKEAVENYRQGFAERSTVSHRLTHLFEPAEDLAPHRAAMAEAEDVVKQLEHLVSLSEHDDYRNRFDEAAGIQAKLQRLDRLSENLEAGRLRREALEAKIQEAADRRLAEERALQETQEHDDGSSVHSSHDEPVELTPQEEHTAFKASLHGMSADELREQAESWRGNPDREYEIDRMRGYQRVLGKEGGLDQHLSDLRREIDETHKQVGDLKRAADVLPDAFKTDAMRRDQAQRREEQEQLVRHQRELANELSQLEFDRADALTAHAMHLPDDPKAPGWRKLSHDDLVSIEDHVNDLMHDARRGGYPTDRLYGLYNKVRDLRIGDPVPEHTTVDSPVHEPAHDQTGHDQTGHDETAHNETGHNETGHEPEPRPFMRTEPSPHTGTPGVDHLMPGSIGAVHEERSLRAFEASLYGLDHNSLSDLRQTHAGDPERSAAIQRMIDLDRHAGRPDVFDNQLRTIEKGLADAQARRDGQANPTPTANRWVRQHEERLAEVGDDRATALTMQALRHPDDPTAPAWRQLGDDDLKTVHDHAQQQIEHARQGGHPTEHLQKFVDFTGRMRSDRGYDDQHPVHEPEPTPEPKPQPFMRPGPSTRSDGVDMDMVVPGGFGPVHEGTPLRSFEASLYGLDHNSLHDMQQSHAHDPERSAAIQKMVDVSRIAGAPDLFDRRIRAAEEGLADAKARRDQRPASEREARQEADERQVQFLDNRLAQLRGNRDAAITLHALRQEDDPAGHGWRRYGDGDLATVHDHVQQQIEHARQGGHPTEHLQRFVDFTEQVGRDRGIDDLSAVHDQTSHHEPVVHEPAPVPRAEPKPQPFMRPEQPPRSAAPDLDMVVPGGFGPVHEGTPLRSFEASLYGLDHNSLRNMQQTHSRDPERSAAIQKMMDASGHAGPPHIVDQRIKLVENRLAEAKSRRDRWTSSDLVPDNFKTESMREEQATRRATDDRDVRYLEDRLTQLRDERDTAITVNALRQEDDPNARGWRSYGDADLATVHDHVRQQIEHAREAGHPTEHLQKFVDFAQQLRDDRQAEGRPAPVFDHATEVPAPHATHSGPKGPKHMSRDEWYQHYNEGRDRAPHRTVNIDDPDVIRKVPRTHADGRPAELSRIDGKIHYDLRRMEVEPGRWVQEHTAKFHLDPGAGVDKSHVEAMKQRIASGVDKAFNNQHRLPGSGDELHVRVEFHDDPAAAHETIRIEKDGVVNQHRFTLDATDREFAHEVGHYVGLPDRGNDAATAKDQHRQAGQDDNVRVFNSDDGRRAKGLDGGFHDLRNRIDDGSSPMGDGLANPNSRYQPVDIRGIEDVAHSHAAVPKTSHDMFRGKQPVPEGLHAKPSTPDEPIARTRPTGTGVGRSFASRVNQHLGEAHESKDIWKKLADEVRGNPERHLPGLDARSRDDFANRIESGNHWDARHVEVANQAVPHAFHTDNFDGHPVSRQDQGHDHGPATREDRPGFFDKIKNAFTPPEPIHLGEDITVNSHREGGFHKLDDHNVFISSHLIDGKDPADAALVYEQVRQYLGNGITLHRGISAWHPTWKHVESGEIPPLGTRPHPDFSTWDTKYVPFTADRNIALGAAMAHTGMHSGADDRRFVHGYDPSNPAQPVGMVLSKRVSAADGHEIAFINSGETQLGGPIHDFGASTLHMGTPLSAVFGGADDGRTLGHAMPPRPDQQEINGYVSQHGALRHDPNGPGWQRPAPSWMDKALGAITGQQQHTPPPLVESHPGGAVTLHLPGHDLPAHESGLFYKFDEHDAYISKAVFQDNADPVDRADLFHQVDQYLTTGLRLQRGIASWHPTWHAVDEGVIPPLGMEDHPNFDTRETRFVPFTTNRHISAGAAVSRTGMDRSDDIRFTPGYDKADPNYQVGAILHKTVLAENGDGVAFILPGETQIAGPIRNYGAEPLTMATPLSHVYGEPAMTGRLGDIMPEKASQQEIDQYVRDNNGLRNDPNPVTSRPAPLFNRDGYVGETEAGPSNHRNALRLDEPDTRTHTAPVTHTTPDTHTPPPPTRRAPRPPAFDPLDTIREDGEPEPVNHDQVPSYVRDGDSLGLGRLLDGDRLADRVRQGVQEQLPHTTEERANARGLDDIHHVVTQDFDSLMGDGRKFEVRVGDKVYEATVKARMDFTDAQHTTEEHRSLERSGGTDRSTSESTTKTKQHDLATAISAGNGIGGGSVFASLLHAKPTVTLESGHGASHSVSLGHEGSDVVNAKASLEITVVDKDGVNHNPAGGVQFDHEATIALPHDAVGTPSHDTTPRHVQLGGLGAFGAESVHGIGEAFDRVAKDLHPKITEIGSPGRKLLQQFVSAGNVRDNLPAMAKDWIYSPDLISSDGSKIGAVRMRIEPTDAALESGADGYKIGSTLGGSGGPGRSNTSTTGGELWLGGSGAGIADPTHSIAAGASLTAAFSKTDSVGTKVGDAAKWQSVLESEGVSGLYKMGFRLHMQVIGHNPVTVHDAGAHIRMSGVEAHHAGLVVPHGAHGEFRPTAQPKHAPSYLSSGKSLGLAKVFHMTGGDDVRQRVDETLRGNENLKNLAPDFGSDEFRNASRGDTALAAANRRELDTKLSDENLKANMNSMLGDGLKVRLKKPGLFFNRYVTVTVKARLTGMEHLGQAPDHTVSGSGATSTKLGITGASKKGVTVYADGRVTTPFTTHQVKGAPTASIGAQYGYQRTHETDAGPSTGHKVSTSGSEDVHGFKAKVHYEVTVEDHGRTRAWVRRLTPGTPGNDVPETHRTPHVAPEGGFSRPARGEVTVLVPESLTSNTAPHQHVDNHVTTRADNPPSINDLRTQARGTRQPEFQRVEAIVGAEHIQRAAVEALAEAGGGDRSLSLSGTVSADALHHAFSPENLASDPQVVKHGVQVDGLQHNRRVADRVGAVGMRMELSEPKLVSISEGISLKHEDTGGYTASGGKQTQHSFGLNFGTSSSRNALTLTPNVEHAHGRAGVFATASLRNWTWTSKLTRSLGGAAEHSVSSPQGRTVLVQMNARVHVVAESRQTSIVHDTDVRTAGRTVDLPDSVFVRVTEQEARDMGVLPDHNLAGDAPVGPRPGLPVPSTLNTERPSIGFGHVEPTGDLADLVPSLRANLGDLGTKLLPQSVLDDAMGNMRRLEEQTSQDGVRSLVDSALNGGVSLITPKPNVFSHDSYEVVLHARPTEEGPSFLGVTNDGSTMSHNATGAMSEAMGKGKEVSSGIGGRFAGTGLPEMKDPAASMTVNNATSASLSHTTSHKITETHSTDLAQNSSSGGVQARYKLPVNFQLEIRHKGEQLAVSDSDQHDLVVRKLADDINTVTDVPVVHEAEVTPFEPRPGEHETWQADGEKLPDEVHVDDFTGDVDQIRHEARELAGDLSTAADHALTTTLTPEVIKANMPAMTKGVVELPGLREAGLSAYAKLTNPRLATVSDSVDLGGGRTDSSKIDTSVSRSVSGSVNAIVGGLGGNVTDPPHSAHHRDVNAGGAGLYLDRGGMEQAQSFGSGGAVHPATGGSTSTSGRSKVVVHDTEIRLVKDDRAVTLKFDGGSRVRMYDDGTLPPAVREAQDKVKDAEKAWKDAEKDVVTAQHAIDDAWRAGRAEVQRLEEQQREQLDENTRQQTDHANQVNELRRELWDAYNGGDRDRIDDIERRLGEAQRHTEQLADDRNRLMEPINEADRGRREAHDKAVDAYQKAREAEDAWWAARRERDAAIAGHNAPEEGPTPEHVALNLPTLDLGAEIDHHMALLDQNTRDAAVHMANAGVARERGMQALRDGDLPAWQQNRALLDRMHTEGEHLAEDRRRIVEETTTASSGHSAAAPPRSDGRADNRHDWFSGRDAAGREHRFPIGDVTQTELRDKSGRVIGTSFFHEPTDQRLADAWAKGGDSDDAVLAFHGNPDTAKLHVRGLGDVQVRPETLASIAVRSEGFAKAVGDGRRTTFLLACEAGAVRGPGGLAHDLHQALAREDVTDRVVAASTVVRFGHRDGERLTELENDGQLTVFERPAPVSAHLLEPIPDLPPHGVVDEQSLTAKLGEHGATEETTGIVLDSAKDAVEGTRTLEGEEAADRLASAMPQAMRLLEKAGVVATLLRQAGDSVTAGLTLSHVLEGVARAWAQGGNAAAAAAVAQDMKRLGLGFGEGAMEGTESNVR